MRDALTTLDKQEVCFRESDAADTNLQNTKNDAMRNNLEALYEDYNQ